MIYFKICKTIKNDFNSDNKLEGTINDLTTILNSEIVTIIKIGYTDDKDISVDTRNSAYRTENPNIIHYKYIKGGDKLDEKKIHTKFKDKLFKGHEWFILDQEIFNFVLRVNSIEDLREELKDISLSYKLKNFRSKNIHEEYIIISIVQSLYPNLNTCFLNPEYCKVYTEIENELYWIRSEELEEYLTRRYSIDIDIFKNLVSFNKPKLDNTPDYISEIAEKFNSIPNVTQKLKLLVEFGETEDRTEKDMENLFQLIPSKYRDYYVLLGPDRIRANSYHESELKKEWLKIHTEETIDDKMIDEIYSMFKKGERYTKSDIKSKLKDLYKKYEYQKTAKASDLESYFYLKGILTPDKKAGFEIIGKK